MNNRKKIVIIGSTSDIGKGITGIVKSAGHQAVEVSRATGISMDDQQALNAAFKNADAAFVMVPFDMMAPDLHLREERLCENLATAVEKSLVPRVVVLSGASAYLKTGSSLGAAILEDKMDALQIPELVHLRCGFFMENFLKGMAFLPQAKSGTFQTAFRGDIPTPMIATKDIAQTAAKILLDEPFFQPRVRELLGARDYTMEEVTQILGTTFGFPDLTYEQTSYDSARKGMIAAGVSASFADAVMETARSFNSGTRWALEPWLPSNTTPTTLEDFAKEAIQTGAAFK